MQTTTIKTLYAPILESISHDTLVKGYFGGSNILAEEINDYSKDGINRYVAEFITDHPGKLDVQDVELILENPDWILQQAAHEFMDGLTYALSAHTNPHGLASHILQKCSHWFDAWGDYFVFCNADTACSWLIRASNESDALEELLTRFEKSFAIDEEDADEETQRNDNGTPVNTDYLTCLAHIKFVKA